MSYNRIELEAWAETKRCAKEHTAIMISTANKAELSAKTAISIANKATIKAKVAYDIEALIVAMIDKEIAAKEIKMLPINNPDGFHQKYNVTKTDGSPCDPEAIYLVLRLDEATNIAARMAAKVYAENTPAKKMGDDLVRAIKHLGDEAWAEAETETWDEIAAGFKLDSKAKTKTWGAVMAEVEVAAKALIAVKTKAANWTCTWATNWDDVETWSRGEPWPTPWPEAKVEVKAATEAWSIAKANLAAWAKAAITARSKAKGETMVVAEAAIKAEAWAASKTGEEAWADVWDEITDWAAT